MKILITMLATITESVLLHTCQELALATVWKALVHRLEWERGTSRFIHTVDFRPIALWTIASRRWGKDWLCLWLCLFMTTKACEDYRLGGVVQIFAWPSWVIDFVTWATTGWTPRCVTASASLLSAQRSTLFCIAADESKPENSVAFTVMTPYNTVASLTDQAAWMPTA